MAHPFPSEGWLAAFMELLNSDEQYARVAAKWEGDITFVVEPDKGSTEPALQLYMDLWHGKCRNAFLVGEDEEDAPKPAFKLRATRSEFMNVLKGELDPMQAMLTRRLRVEGNMAYMLRHVPTVLDFVRCAKLVGITD